MVAQSFSVSEKCLLLSTPLCDNVLTSMCNYKLLVTTSIFNFGTNMFYKYIFNILCVVIPVQWCVLCSLNGKLWLVGRMCGWGVIELSRSSMWLVSGHFFWQYLFTLYPFFSRYLSSTGWNRHRPHNGATRLWSGFLAPERPIWSNVWHVRGLWIPYSGHNHMSISSSISWQVGYPVASAWLWIPRREGYRLIPQTWGHSVAVGCRSQDTCVSCLAPLLRGTSW